MGRPAEFGFPAFLILVLTTFQAAPLRSQTAKGADPAPNSQSQVVPLAKNQIRVGTKEVVAAVTVTNKKREPFVGLTQTDFHVFDDGIEQTIDHWDVADDPFAVVLVIETSEHIQMILPAVRKTGGIFTETVMALSGEAAVVTYDDTVDIRQPFTTDHESIETAIEKVEVGPQGMRLYDAMARANSLLEAQPSNWRRVMLVIGEAQDGGSNRKLGEVLRDAQLANVSIYTIGVSTISADLRYGSKRHRFVSPPPEGSPDLGALAMWLVEFGTNAAHNHALEVSAAATGGTHYRTLKDHTIQNALDDIGGELHTQYNLSYQPGADAQPGYHEIRVTVTRPDAIVRTRPGYFLTQTKN